MRWSEGVIPVGTTLSRKGKKVRVHFRTGGYLDGEVVSMAKDRIIVRPKNGDPVIVIARSIWSVTNTELDALDRFIGRTK